MPEQLPPGLYDAIITERLDAAIAGLEALRAEIGALDAGTSHLYFAQHLKRELEAALREFPEGERVGRQLELSNRIIALLAAEFPGHYSDEDHLTQRLLRALYRANPSALAPTKAPQRPGIPLSQSELLVNARQEHRIGYEIDREIRSADRIDLLCSFIKWSGLRLIQDPLREFCLRDGRLRILTTVYMGATDRRALDALVDMGAEVRVSYDTRRTRLHAKAWLFHRNSEFTTGYIGSSNLSAAAQTDGLEWNVRISAVDSPRIVKKFDATFDSYWNDPEFTRYTASDDDRKQFDVAVRRETVDDEGDSIAYFDIRPFPYQQEILERLDAERRVHHRNANLVVAATGTGKTVVAALDYKRMVEDRGDRSLLFVAHRREILRQSRSTFRQVLRDGNFGEEFYDGTRPEEGRHVFASIQSLANLDLSTVDPHTFDVLIVDEFHHAAAATYDRILQHFKPEILLGLTATPERADGGDIRTWFDGHIAAELRLWDAIDRGLLAPFQYFGVHDDVDLSHVTWTRGRYDEGELEHLYTANDARVNMILQATQDRIADLRTMRALGFCVGVSHARFMAERFSRAGIPSMALTADTPKSDRDDAVRRLRKRELNALFTVDLFNEGVDIPEADTVLFLRPTESATVFLQQLGRGLRLHESKECLTVLDFIGNARREFRFDARFRALTGSTRRELEQQIESGFPLLPSGCAIQLDRESRDAVLENVKQAIGAKKNQMVSELKRLGPATTLAEFVRESGLELEDIYRGHRFFADLRRAAGFDVPPPGPNEDKLGGALGRMLHLDDPDRIAFYQRFLSTPQRIDRLQEFERRQLMMLLCTMFGPNAAGALPAHSELIRKHPAIVGDLLDLLPMLHDRVSHVPLRTTIPADIPLYLHCSYSRDEIMAAFADVRNGVLSQPREGVVFNKASRCNLLFVTLNKSDREYSPSTMYEDYAISPWEFHWQSQSTTRPESEKGRRHVAHDELGITPLLFIRVSKRDENGVTMPYIFAGPVICEHHEGARPMNVIWRLQTAMPADLVRTAGVAV